jgi:hypothetical protein
MSPRLRVVFVEANLYPKLARARRYPSDPVRIRRAVAQEDLVSHVTHRSFLNYFLLFVRDAVKLVNQIVNSGVVRGSLAPQAAG